MTPRWGFPVRLTPQSLTSTIIVEPTLGLEVSQPSVDAPLGSTPSSDNYIMREGGLEPRPMLSLRQTSPQPMGNIPILGGLEAVDVTGVRSPVISGTTRWGWYSNGSWSVLSYVSAFGIDNPPAGTNTDYWDMTQIYSDLRDENFVVGGNGSYQTLYCHQSNTTIFSSLTGAPRARYLTPFDNYLLAFNIREGTSDFVQRVRWNDRGSISSWTGGLSGFEDLLDLRGQGTRILPLENRIILFSDAEVWQGFPVDFPFVFRFQPLDRSLGCPYSWTAATTPLGIMFLGKDYQVYLLSKSGGPAQPIGQRLHREIRTTIDQPQRSFAVYDNTFGQYQLYYPIKGGSGRPQRAVYLDIAGGSWAPQSFDRISGNLSPTRGFEAQLSSSATTWGGLQAAGIRWADLTMSWAELAGASEERAVFLGSSNGTMYYLNSNATSDNGTPVESRWRSSALQGFEPERQKTVTQWRVDYQADSSSSLTVRFSQNQGASFDLGTRINLPVASGLSQSRVDPYVSARYPMFEITSEAQRYRAFRFYVEMRRGGR